MMSQKSVIIGAGLSGQLAAYLLSKKGYSVLLCEAEKEIGGRCRVDHIQGCLVDHTLALNLLKPKEAQRLGLPLTFAEIKEPSLFYHQKEWHPLTENVLPSPLTEGQKLYAKISSLMKGGAGSLFQYLKTSNCESALSRSIIEVEVCDQQVTQIKSIQQ